MKLSGGGRVAVWLEFSVASFNFFFVFFLKLCFVCTCSSVGYLRCADGDFKFFITFSFHFHPINPASISLSPSVLLRFIGRYRLLYLRQFIAIRACN